MLQPKITHVAPLDDYQIALVFEDEKSGIFDVKPYLTGSWFGQLLNPAYFRTVRIVEDGYGIAWAGGQDIAPHELYELCNCRASA